MSLMNTRENKEIKDFSELHNPDELLQNLLIGNGFSIWFSDRFKYHTLLEKCTGLEPADMALFERLETSNFEYVLNALNNARDVDDLYGIKHSHDQSYERIKDSLIEVIRKVHMDYADINGHKFERAMSLLKKSTNIFTTNYDMLLYWTILKINDDLKRDRMFGDLFFNQPKSNGLHFSEEFKKNKERWIFYLHGALHLYTKGGLVKKMNSGNSSNLLGSLERNIDEGHPPLFVSEGDWKLKQKQVALNPYLRYCMKCLKTLKGSLTIFGHSLDRSADKHIIKTICDSEVDKIIYGMYCGDKDGKSIDEEIARIRKDFENKEVEFFDSDSLFNYTYDPGFGNLELS